MDALHDKIRETNIREVCDILSPVIRHDYAMTAITFLGLLLTYTDRQNVLVTYTTPYVALVGFFAAATVAVKASKNVEEYILARLIGDDSSRSVPWFSSLSPRNWKARYMQKLLPGRYAVGFVGSGRVSWVVNPKGTDTHRHRCDVRS